MATQFIDLGTIDNTITPTPPNDDYVITGKDGNNTITLGNGDNLFTLGDGSNTVTVGDGTELLVFGAGNNTVTTGNGNSDITVGDGSNTIVVGTGGNKIALGDGLNTVNTAAGNNLVSVAAAALTADIIMGALNSGDGSTNRLVLTTAGTMIPTNVSGFQTFQLGNGGANSLTLAEGNFARLPDGVITVIGGDSGNKLDASALSAAHSVIFNAGTGTDALTGGAGDDRFRFAPGNVMGDLVNGGTGNNIIELAGGGIGTLDGLGTKFVEIDQVVLAAGAAWTIGFNDTASFGGSIAGFSSDDTFDLANVTFDAGGTAVLDAKNKLHITEGGVLYTIQLDPTDDFTGRSFHLTTNGSGTQVTLDNAPCYCAGTHILTDRGEIAVENLAVGDNVITGSGASRPIAWIGIRHVDCSRHGAPQLVWPVRVSAGAFGTSLPHRDLWLSPDHAVFAEDVLIPIKHLMNGTSIAQVPRDSVVYYHVELSTHDILLAEGLPAESYLGTDSRLNFENADGAMQLFPDFSTPAPDSGAVWEALGYAPLAICGSEFDAVRRCVETHAAMAGRRTVRPNVGKSGARR
ncbi:Hint domain-containing protein [Thiocapsa sp. UBA6158]|uniref:Hint domain-containing protein n=1 Tax=Thiocapsa sp. UBA6158 TaxID=1947692 RepID=UPI0025CB7CC8|nr:Hint domain-containing protein [Thiocapsa sp. UBA6158]